MSEYRIERDSMGELKVPADALYGAQTLSPDREIGVVPELRFIGNCR